MAGREMEAGVKRGAQDAMGLEPQVFLFLLFVTARLSCFCILFFRSYSFCFLFADKLSYTFFLFLYTFFVLMLVLFLTKTDFYTFSAYNYF